MKRIILSMLMLFALVSFAQAQTNTHPQTFAWVLEDSTGLALWNIGTGTDSDTSTAFSVFRMPETGLGFQFYTNATDADTGQICFILQQNSLLSNAGGFADSAAAVDFISSWVYVDSISVGLKNGDVATSTGRSSYAWNPTLIGPTNHCRIIAIRRSGTTARTVAILRTRQD